MKLNIFEAPPSITRKVHPDAIKGPAWMNNMGLTDLADRWKSRTKEVDGDVLMVNNQLKNLKGGPTIIHGTYNASKNKLTTFEGSPTYVSKDFIVYGNRLTDFLGLHIEVGGDVDLSNNLFRSLKDIHKHILHTKTLSIEDNPIESHVLGIFKIKGLEALEFFPQNDVNPKGITADYTETDNKVAKIVNDCFKAHGATNVGLLECQEQLIDAGFHEYAQL
jgi:hypothetical protein